MLFCEYINDGICKDQMCFTKVTRNTRTSWVILTANTIFNWKHWESADLLGQSRSLLLYCRLYHVYEAMWSCQGATMLLHTALSWWWKANPKGSGSWPAPRSGHATDVMCFAHLVILDTSGHHQNLIRSSLYSTKFNHNPFITFWVMLTPNRQTDEPVLPKT